MAFGDPAFAREMHELVPRIEVFPCRLLDGGAVVLRARLTVDLTPLLGRAGEGVGGSITRTAVVDLFDPPQREALRERVVALRGEGRTEREVARELAITVTAAQRAMALHRLTQDRGLTDPYEALRGRKAACARSVPGPSREGRRRRTYCERTRPEAEGHADGPEPTAHPESAEPPP
jgi:hypothetical protein